MRVAELGVADLRRIGEIDRSEHVDRHYGVSDGRLVERPVPLAEPRREPGGKWLHGKLFAGAHRPGFPFAHRVLRRP